MGWIEQNGAYGPKQTELTEMNRMDRNSLNGPKCYVNVAQIRA